MYSYSRASMRKLDTCDRRLRDIFYTVLDNFDHTILCGHRTEQEQDLALEEGLSQLGWPDSEHNTFPSNAVDVCPYPWNFQKPNMEKLYYFGGFIKGVAASLDIGLRWGGDWNMNINFEDENFRDMYHFELTNTLISSNNIIH